MTRGDFDLLMALARQRRETGTSWVEWTCEHGAMQWHGAWVTRGPVEMLPMFAPMGELLGTERTGWQHGRGA